MLLERGTEVTVLAEAVARARGGSGGVVLVEGPAGIGKTELLAGIDPPDDVVVRRASGSELGREWPFGTARELAATDELPSGEELDRLYALFRSLPAVATETPTVLVVDDAHWLDDASARFLLFTAQRARDVPLALVVAARTGEPSDLVDRLAASPDCTRLLLSPLSEAASAELVKARIPEATPELCHACAAATAGNPLYLRLVADEVAHRGAADVDDLTPERLVRGTVVRLRSLGPGATAIARAAAVFGGEATLGEVAGLAELPLDDAAAAADLLTRADIFEPGDPVRFVHPILRSAVAESIPAAERAALHARAARLLHDAAASPERVAGLLLDAVRSGDPWVVGRLREAAARELEAGGATAAARFLTRALEEPPGSHAERAQILTELAEAEAQTGALTAIDRLEDAAAAIDDPLARAAVMERLGWTLYEAGRMSDARRAFEGGLAVPGIDRTLEEGLKTAQFAVAAIDGSLTTAELAGRLAQWRESTSGPDSPALAQLAVAHVFGNTDAATAAELAGRALAAMQPEGAARTRVSSLLSSIALSCLIWADVIEPVEHAIEVAIDDARTHGSPALGAYLHFGRSWCRYWTGDVADAAADAGIAIEAWRGGWSMHLGSAAHWAVGALVELDRVDEAEALLTRLGEEPASYQASELMLRYAHGRVAFARGRYEEARDLLLAVARSSEPYFANASVVPVRSQAALAAAATGDLATARTLTEVDLDLARRFGAPRGIGIALRGRALVEGGEHGAALLAEAVEVLDASPSRLELLRVLVDRGALLRSLGRRAEARASLRRALELAEATTAVALRRRARQELEATGVRLAPEEPRSADDLTPSERRIVELARAGRTNPEIARELFVTRKTVEFHLSNAYRKLGVAGRAELAGPSSYHSRF